MLRSGNFFAFATLLTLLLVSPLAAQTRTDRASIELEVHMINAGVGAQQTWGEMLATVGADISSIKSSRKRAKVEVEESTFGNRKYYRIVGVVSGNRLMLPGGKTFTTRDKDRIAAYIKMIRDDGPKVALSEKMAFGLTASQLVALQQDLAKPHRTKTRGVNVMDVVEKIADAIDTPIQVDASAREKLSRENAIKEELGKLSSGTTLAAILRPLGVVAMPQRPQGKQLRIVLIDSRKADEFWPVGWPSERGNAITAPSMFKKQDFEIRNYELKKILDAIEGIVKIPFIYDQNTMARHGAELTKLKATVEKKDQTYFAVVRLCLTQVRPQMKQEIRVDEAGQPFVWITTFKK